MWIGDESLPFDDGAREHDVSGVTAGRMAAVCQDGPLLWRPGRAGSARLFSACTLTGSDGADSTSARESTAIECILCSMCIDLPLFAYIARGETSIFTDNGFVRGLYTFIFKANISPPPTSPAGIRPS